MSQSNQEMVHCCGVGLEKTTLQNDPFFFLICGQLMRYPFTELFHLSNFLQMLNELRMVDTEFFGKFSLALRGSASVILCWSASPPDGRPLCSSSSRLWLSFAKLLEPPLHCMIFSCSWAKCAVDIVSCSHCFKPHFDLK